MSCQCILCEYCEGTGNVCFDMKGNYLGKNRCDDMDELMPCEECNGTGIDEICDGCQRFIDEEVYD